MWWTSPNSYIVKHTHKAIDADTLAVVDASDGCNDIVEEDLWKSIAHHRFLQSLIHQGKKTITAHGMQEPLHAGEWVTILLILVDPVRRKDSHDYLDAQQRRSSDLRILC